MISTNGRLPGRPAGSTSLALLLAVALLVGLALRTAGLAWGLPNAQREYPYHPDEPLLALAALRVDFGALRLSPQFFNYGSLSIYLDRLAVNAAARAGWIRLAFDTRPEIAGSIGAVIRVGRWLTVLMGVVTIAATAALGARLFGPGCGALASLFLALAPLHLTQGHYCTVDVPATLWTTLCLLLCAAVLDRPDRGLLALAGACAGLAASTKYNAGIVLVAPLYTLIVTWSRAEWYASDRAAALFYTPLAAVAAFILTTPGILIDSHRFWTDFSYELAHSAAGHGLVFANTPPAWLYHLTRTLPEGLGLPMALAAIAGLIWAVARHTPGDGLLLIFVLAYFMVIGGAQVKFARYLMPILPALILLGARFLAGEEASVKADARRAGERPADTLPLTTPPVRSRVPRRPLDRYIPLLRGAALVVVLCWTASYGVAMAAVYTRVDPRDQAARWIEAARGPGEQVALAGEPWFYTPPLAPSLGCTHALAGACGAPLPLWILAPSPGQEALPASLLLRDRPRFVLASEFVYEDSLRLLKEQGRTDAVTALLAALPDHYHLARTFRNRPYLGPVHWFQERPPVHDLLYPMADVRIYELSSRRR